jgi:hypothetical protein
MHIIIQPGRLSFTVANPAGMDALPRRAMLAASLKKEGHFAPYIH